MARLTRGQFELFCWAATKEEHQADYPPEGYVPTSFDDDPGAWERSETKARMDRGRRMSTKAAAAREDASRAGSGHTRAYATAIRAADPAAGRAALAQAAPGELDVNCLGWGAAPTADGPAAVRRTLGAGGLSHG